MDEFEQKLAGGSPIIQFQAVGTIINNVISNTNKETFEHAAEVSSLYEIVRTGSVSCTEAALSGLLTLMKENYLSPVTLLTKLLAEVVSAQSSLPTVQAITTVMLFMCEARSSVSLGDNKLQDSCSAHQMENPFTGPPVGPVLPYVTLIRKKPELSHLVLDECFYLLNHTDRRVRAAGVSMIRPLLLFLASLSESPGNFALDSLTQMLQQTVRDGLINAADVIDLLLDVAQYTRSCKPCEIHSMVTLVSNLASLALLDHNRSLQQDILPALVTLLPIASTHGVCTRMLVRLIEKLLDSSMALEAGGDAVLAALALALPRLSGSLVTFVLKACVRVMHGSFCNPLLSSCLMPSLLQVLSAPCRTTPDWTTVAEVLTVFIQSKKQDMSCQASHIGNVYWKKVRLALPDLPVVQSLVLCCNALMSSSARCIAWLTALSQSSNPLTRIEKLIVSGVFLHSDSPISAVHEAAKVLKRSLVENRSGAEELFPMLLYRLANDRSPDTRLIILHLMPSLATNKVCVPLLLKTLYLLWSTASLRPLILRLTLDMWRLEPRVYSHLLRLLSEAEEKSLLPNAARDAELCIARAFVISAICKEKGSQHGEELLPILSTMLNSVSGSAVGTVRYSSCCSINVDGTVSAHVATAICCLALEAITELVRGGVIDLRTTWRVLAPQLAKDKRPEVIARLCRLLALASSFKIKSDEYEKFTSGILTLLWSWTTHSNKGVVEAAYFALGQFKTSLFVLKMLPAYARANIKLPAGLAATPCDAARKPEDVLDYVPGEAWLELIYEAKKFQHSCLEDFIKSLIKKEVSGLYKGLYLTAIQEARKHALKGSGGQPEPLTYSFMKDFSILRATIAFLHKVTTSLQQSNAKEGEKLLNALTILLRALGQPLHRPYPALDWILLAQVQEAVKEWSARTKQYAYSQTVRHAIFSILAKQCNKSASASAYIMKFLLPNLSNGLKPEDEIYLFGLLDYLGRGIPPATLQPFVSFTLNKYIDNDDQLKSLLEAVKPVLTSDFMHDSNRNALGNAIESLNEKIDPTKIALYSSYKACVADLPSKHIERLTSPTLWWEVTSERLYRAAVLRCHVAANDPEKIALPWLNDIVDSSASLPGDRSELLRVIAAALKVRCSDEECTTWFLQLLGRLHEQVKKKAPDNIVGQQEYAQRIIFYSDLLVVSLMIWCGNYHFNDKMIDCPTNNELWLEASVISLYERPLWQAPLMQFLNCLVSDLVTLKEILSTRHDLAASAVLIAKLTADVSKQMWCKVIQLNLNLQ